jgi:hypothetical protein
LIQIKRIFNIADTSTYEISDFYWLGQRPVALWTTSFPSASTTRFFIHADEENRVLEVQDWPTSGDGTIVWAANPDLFGWDRITSNIFQPLRLSNALADDGTVSVKSATGFPVIVTLDRPAMISSNGACYDPMTETSLQLTGQWPNEPYADKFHRTPARKIANPFGNSDLRPDDIERQWTRTYWVAFWVTWGVCTDPGLPRFSSADNMFDDGNVQTPFMAFRPGLGGLECTPHLVLSSLRVKCDKGCGADTQTCVVEAEGNPRNGYAFKDDEFGTDVPDVHYSGSSKSISFDCTCGCGPEILFPQCCKPIPGEGDTVGPPP